MEKIVWFIGIFLFATIISFFSSIYPKEACSQKSDCVPAACCHPDTCVNTKYKPDCKGVACTLECKPGAMDCGQGYCDCIDNECKSITK